LHLLPAGLARRLPRRLGRHSGGAARLPHAALQFRRDHAAARRASAPAQGEGRDALTLTVVIPGRAQHEPGIQRAATRVGDWIPGSRYASPGMTKERSVTAARRPLSPTPTTLATSPDMLFRAIHARA